MRFVDLIRTACRNLARRRLRSFLTISGVVIAACLVTLLVSMGIGMRHFMSAQVEALMPSDVVLVVSSQGALQLGLAGLAFGENPQQVAEGTGSRYALNPIKSSHIEEIAALEFVDRVDPYIMFTTWSASRLDGPAVKAMARALPDYQVRARVLSAGSYISEDASGVCIIAGQLVESLGFASPQDALGEEIIIRVRQAVGMLGLPSNTEGVRFQITGVAEPNVQATEILIPQSDAALMARFWAGSDDMYTERMPPSILQVRVGDVAYMDQVTAQVKNMGLGAMGSNEVMGFVGTIFNVIEGLLGAFGLIALGVATLGIINTLVMSIHERTREIGVMKATGACRGTIRKLFTLEGALIGLTGGVFGVGIAYILGAGINELARLTFLSSFVGTQVSYMPWWLLVGVVITCTVVALVASLYPSLRAARMDPIEALRFE